MDKQNYGDSILNRYKVFENIDVITQYRLESLFSPKEITNFVDHIKAKNKHFEYDKEIEQFINNKEYLWNIKR